MNEQLLGMLLVAIAGLGTGSIAWPMKLIRRLKFEHYWFLGMLVGLVVVPWTVVLATIERPWTMYAEVGWRPLVVSNAFAICWGIANVLYGLCVVRIGAALTGAILSGLGVTAGVTLPMLVKGSGLFEKAPDLASPAGVAVLAGVAVMVLGVTVSAWAGFGRDRVLNKSRQAPTGASGSFLTGLVMAAVAGVISCGIALAFVYGQDPIVAAAKSRGAGELSANVAVWAAGLLGGALVNIAFPAYLMTKNGSWGELARSLYEDVLGAIIGIQFICAIALLGVGMLLLGSLGASVGFGIQQAMQILGNQAVGFASGEWRSVRGAPRAQMFAAVAILLAAVALLGFANTLSGR